MRSTFRIVLTAENVDHCPLFDAGHRMILSLPGIDRKESDQLCIYALYSFFPLLVTLSRHENPEQLFVEPGRNRLSCCRANRFACCGEGNSAVFQVAVDRNKEKTAEAPSEPSTRPDIERKKNLIPFLSKLPFFQAISEVEIERLLEYFRFQQIPGGTSIIRQGEPGHSFYILLKGQVEVTQDAGTLEQKTLAVLGRGECFGEMSLLSNSPCSATVTSRDSITIMSLSKEEFHKLLADSSSLRLFFAKLLAKRLEKTQQSPAAAGKQEGLSGTLETFPVAELVQTVFRQHLTGGLFLFSSERTGQLFFDQGELINAITGTTKGAKAFYKILFWTEGRFLFRSAPKLNIKREIHQNTMALILDGMRIMDEVKSRAG